MKHGRGFAQTVQTKYREVQTVQTKSEALNLEAAVARCALGVHSVCSCSRRVQGLVLGLVVAGRFWCSYAWVSLTPTAPARPRGCLCACVRLCVGVCLRGCARACVLLGVV